MTERRLVATLCYGDDGAALAALTADRLAAYARQCRADLRVLTPPAATPYAEAMLAKMDYLRTALAAYDRVLWVDLDVLIHPEAPNLFDLAPAPKLAMADECAVADDAEVAFRHQHMARVCAEEGLPVPDSKGRYFNCGLALAPAACAWLYEPRRNPVPHNWAEQSVVNVRLFLRPETPLCALPECCNRFAYWSRKPRRYESMTWFLHYAGPPDPATRLRDMAAQRDRWLRGE